MIRGRFEEARDLLNEELASRADPVKRERLASDVNDAAGCLERARRPEAGRVLRKIAEELDAKFRASRR